MNKGLWILTNSAKSKTSDPNRLSRSDKYVVYQIVASTLHEKT